MFEKWITNQTAKPFYARKEITLDKTIKKAAAKVCGLGQFHFHINGKKVGDHELDPAWTARPRWASIGRVIREATAMT